MMIFQPAQARKTRSEQLLHRRGIAVDAELPPLPDEQTVRLRPAWEVAERALALFAVAARAEGLDQAAAIQFLEERSLWMAATREEQTFLLDPEPDEQDRLQFVWRYESLWVLLWALGHLENLGWPGVICDIERVTLIAWRTPVEAFVEMAALRPAGEILDAADLTYRCHWAAVDARLRGEDPPGDLDASIVYERHYALNWLTCHLEQEWDDVSTDV
ncbi:DUF4272 domain-containing protein [Gloeobacter morelensis]|uniref:DUF4272 domain-containing protein n=1 Tax=Gloeobacter morelensis MG652769 TaxID=2781736 RepID=A0ABY3PJX1_9CYAN|nr:DUF4272 domain-containing protein [Gloeobacter morelensis]UFP93923.1 DUF4272 domain-containing protein [Gloeobacter morelensis MG652769]